jgi:hypothetical protein
LKEVVDDGVSIFFEDTIEEGRSSFVDKRCNIQ